MELSDIEKQVLDRYHEKCRIAGGPRLGYVLRKEAIAYPHGDGSREAVDRALAELVGKGLLQASEDGKFYFLAEAGVETLESW